MLGELINLQDLTYYTKEVMILNYIYIIETLYHDSKKTLRKLKLLQSLIVYIEILNKKIMPFDYYKVLKLMLIIIFGFKFFKIKKKTTNIDVVHISICKTS